MIDNKQEFLDTLIEARKLNEQVNELKAKILDGLDDLDVIPFNAGNADNLSEAIQCYIDYDELPISGNIDDFWLPYSEAVESAKLVERRLGI